MSDNFSESFQPGSIAASFVVSACFEIIKKAAEHKEAKIAEASSNKELRLEATLAPEELLRKSIITHLKLNPSTQLAELLKDQVVAEELCVAILKGDFHHDSNEVLKGLEIDKDEFEQLKKKLVAALSHNAEASRATLLSQSEEQLYLQRKQQNSIYEIQGKLNEVISSAAGDEDIRSLKKTVGDLAYSFFSEANEFAKLENTAESLSKYLDCLGVLEKTESEDKTFLVKVLLRIASQHAIENDDTNNRKYIDLAKASGATATQIKEAEAFMLTYSKDTEKALDIYKALAILEPEDRYLENIAVLLLRLNKTQELTGWLNKLPVDSSNCESLKSLYYEELDDYKKAYESANKALEINPDNVRVNLRLHLYILSLHDKEERQLFLSDQDYLDLVLKAFSLLDNLLGKEASVIGVSDEELIENYRSNTIAYSCNFNLTHCVKKVATQLKSKGVLTSSTQVLCQWLIREGKKSEALDVVNSYESDEEEYESFRYYVLAENHQFQEVTDHFNKHRARLSENPGWIELVAVSYWEDYEHQKAIDFCTEYLNHPVVGKEARLQLAAIYYKKEDFIKAEVAFKNVLVEVNEVSVAVTLAKILKKIGKQDEAYDLFKEYECNRPSSRFVTDFIGTAYNLKKDTECVALINQIERMGIGDEFCARIRAAILYRSSNIQDCLSCIKLYKSKDLISSHLAEIEAQCYVHLDDVTKALGALNAYKVKQGSMPLSLEILRTRLLVQVDSYAEALSRAIELVKENPEELEVRHNLAAIGFENNEMHNFSDEELECIQNNFQVVLRESNSFTSIQMKRKADGDYDFSELFAFVKKRHNNIKVFEQKCKKHKLPYGCIANYSGRTSFEIFGAIKPKLLTGKGSVSQSVYQSIKSNGVAIDASSIVTLHFIGLLEPLVESGIKIYVHQSAIDELIQLKRSVTSKSHSTMHAAKKGRFTLTERTDEDSQELIGEYDDILSKLLRPNVLKKGCQIEVERASELESELVEFENRWGSTFSSMQLAIEYNLVLLCDDERLRGWATNYHNLSSVSSTTFIRSFTAELNIGISDIIDSTSKLRTVGYTTLGFTTEELKLLLQNKDDKALSILGKEIKKGDYTLISVLPILSEIFVWSVCSTVVGDREYQVSWLKKIVTDYSPVGYGMLRLLAIGAIAYSCRDIAFYKKVAYSLMDDTYFKKSLNVPETIIWGLDHIVQTYKELGAWDLAVFWLRVRNGELTLLKGGMYYPSFSA